MRTSRTSSNIQPRTPDNQTPQSKTRSNGKTLQANNNDPSRQIKLLLPVLGKEKQTMGTEVRRLYQIQKN